MAEETLHALAAGELASDVARSIETHVDECPSCRLALDRVRGLRGLMSAMAPAPLDDLRWARLGRRVQAELRTPVPTRPALEIGRWLAPFIVVAATATATAVVVMAWPGRPSEPTMMAHPPLASAAPPLSLPVEPEALRSPSPVMDLDHATLQASSEPFDLELKSGLTLRLAPRSEVRLVSSKPEKVVLHLMRGKLEVSSVAGQGPQVELRAPDLRATARGASFTVALVTGTPAVLQVQQGDVHVTRPAAPRASPSPILRDVEVPAAAPAAVTPAPADPWTTAQRDFQDGRYELAAETARSILAAGAAGDEARRAMFLICDAELALGHAEGALKACEALLPQSRGNETRLVSFRLAQVYRTQLNDCARAIRHYDRVVVVGSGALINHDALLGRAECALKLGDLDMAARDLGFLGGQSLARPDAYRVLIERLRAARNRTQESDR